jgi:quinolinate synthase
VVSVCVMGETAKILSPENAKAMPDRPGRRLLAGFAAPRPKFTAFVTLSP